MTLSVGNSVAFFFLVNSGGGGAMPSFDPELIAIMRRVLDEVVAQVPLESSNSSAKAYLAECILTAAAQGQTSYGELMTAATDQIPKLISLL